MKKNNENLILLSMIFGTALVIANVVSGKVIQTNIPLFGSTITFPGAVICYSITFLVTDIVGEIWGSVEANRIVKYGFIAQILATILIVLTGMLPAADSLVNESYNILLGQNVIFVIGSLVAYVISQSWDVWVFHKIRNKIMKKEKNKVIKVDVEDIKVNDVLVVKKGERIPVDGIVLNGDSFLDTSALTGESELVTIKNGDTVLSGSVNTGDIIEIKATRLFENSTVSKILDLLDEATDKKAKTETIVSKISKIYTPIIMILAIMVIVLLPFAFDITHKESLYRGLTFLVISCPCAIAISVPLSYFTGIGVASKKGILIKGSNYLDNLSSAKNIIFDKTGTLTDGTFTVTNIEIFGNDYTKDEIIDILVKGESFSNHPIAKSFLKLKEEKIDNSDISRFKEVDGKGISYIMNNKKIKVGNKLMCGCDKDSELHLNIDGKHIASISINDGIKENAKETINRLKKYGIKTYMFTGDKKEVALNIGKKLDIDEIKYEMLPTDKFKSFEHVSNNKLTIFVGDGINDAPVLKRADIGISMGGVGSQSAIEASDIVLMSDDLIKIPQAINISHYTKKIIKQNLIFAITVKITILLLSIFGFANMWLAVFADTGVTLITILNTLRIMKKFK